MSNLLLLLKIQFIEITGINKFLKEESQNKRMKSLGLGLLIAFSLVMLALLSGMYFTMIANGLKTIGYLELILVICILATIGMTFFTSIYKAQGILFGSKDYDVLMSLPIKYWVILSSKMLNLVIVNYFFMAFVIIPGVIVYFNYAEASPIIFLYAGIMFFFVPFIPIVLGSIFAFIISYISSKIKYKNMILTVGTIFLFIGIMYISSDLNKVVEKLILNGKGLTEAVYSIYPPAEYFTNAIINLSFISLSKFILWSLGAFIIFVFVLAKIFKKINSSLGESYKTSNYKLSALKTNSPIKALVNKEFKRYFASTTYVLNTFIGMILLSLLSLSIVFFNKEVILNILKIPDVGENLGKVLIIVIAFLVGLTCTTSSSISMEGKNLWIIKSIPIRAEEIFKSKIIVNLLLTIPFIIVNVLILQFSNIFSLMDSLWAIIVPSLLVTFMALSGLMLNLKFPKLDWTNEAMVVKQSLSVFLSMLIGMGSCLLGIALFMLFKGLDFNILMIGISTILVVLNVFIWKWLKSRGRELFYKIN